MMHHLAKLLLVCSILATNAATAFAYKDINLSPGTMYHASDVGHVHSLIRKYMRYSTAASSFVDFESGWTSCGIACNSPDVRNVMLNMTWHRDMPLSDGFIAIHHLDREIIVAWAGTHRYRAVLMDMAVLTMPYLRDEDMNVHNGFLDSVRGVIHSVQNHLERLLQDYPDYMVIFTGHSKGGAEAALSALDLARSIGALRGRMRVWTFGEPRLGDSKFGAFYNQQLGNVTYRVTGEADPVVVMPPRFMFDYCHHDREIWLMNPEGDIYVGRDHAECNEDPGASNSVPFFERTIQSHKNYLGLPPPDHAEAEFSW